jgi:hypothetical protein
VPGSISFVYQYVLPNGAVTYFFGEIRSQSDMITYFYGQKKKEHKRANYEMKKNKHYRKLRIEQHEPQ